MAQTSKKLNILSNQKLSIQISLSGLSFCVLQLDRNTITFLKHVYPKTKLNPFGLLDLLKQVFETEDALKETFETVTIIHENELSTLIPKPLFNESDLAGYLKFNSKILKSDFIAYDTIEANESENVYVPYVNINNFIYERFGAFSYKHSSTLLIEHVLGFEKNAEDSKMYINICTNHFEIIVTDKGQLQLYNTFEYNSKEDFIYYILFTAEQLQLNPETLNLILLGSVTKDDTLYAIAYKYIRNVSFGNRFDTYNYNTIPESNHSDFTLIKSF